MKAVKKGFSEGRVQCVALRLIVEREREVKAFQAEEYWIIEVELEVEQARFLATLIEQNDKKLGEYKKLAYLLRAVLVDHPFSDGNKRTAMFIALAFAEENKKQVDRELLLHHIVSIFHSKLQSYKRSNIFLLLNRLA